jgi:fructose-1,6-bisphosphatase
MNGASPIVLEPSRYVAIPSMVWKSSMSQFILNQMVELVKNMDICSHGFTKSRMKKAMHDVLEFIGCRSDRSSTVQAQHEVEEEVEPYMHDKRERQAQME